MKIFHTIVSSALNMKFFLFLIKQQLKKTLREFMLYIVTASIYTLMKRKSDLTLQRSFTERVY